MNFLTRDTFIILCFYFLLFKIINTPLSSFYEYKLIIVNYYYYILEEIYNYIDTVNV